ncbi:MAG: DUF2878 family protein [Candidatus Aenigmarchaeota archaeon]|nr:DUF2878 family protein [Candidatus Aenigmarchaeota archaeon]
MLRLIEKNKREIFYETIFYLVGIGSTILFYKNNILLTGILFISWMFAIKIWHGKKDVQVYIVSAVFGPVGEMAAIYFGVWSYSNPTVLGIPMWLPFLWGMAGMLLYRISTIFVTDARRK